MNIRRRLKDRPEVYTGSLNDILFILLLFFLIVSTLANPNVIKVNNPKGQKDTKVKQNIVVSIDKEQHIYVGQTAVSDYNQLDTVLMAAVNKLHETVDTPSVVINADTVSYYGDVFKNHAGGQKGRCKGRGKCKINRKALQQIAPLAWPEGRFAVN